MPHPLDRPVRSALTGPLAACAIGTPLARRLDPSIGVFAAAADASSDSLAALAALIPPGDYIGMIEPVPCPPLPGITATHHLAVQMVAAAPDLAEPGFPYIALSPADAPDMLALATLTEPGPFRLGAQRLGQFYGVRGADGTLVAMAGMRLRVPGYVEVSGVCTHPEHRGRGFAGGLMRRVMRDIVAGGDIPCLHANASRTGAIALYERLGFHLRQSMTYSLLERG